MARRVRWVTTYAACLLVVAGGSLPSASRAATDVSPGLFKKVSTGVALISTYGCAGRPIGQGTGFLVGDSVVMTARHVVQGACRVRVRVNGDTFAGKRWVTGAEAAPPYQPPISRL
jgi:S1-C subfamily serine protease